MIKIKLICVGKVKEEYYRDKIEELKSRINREGKYCLEIIEVMDESIPKNAGVSIMESIKKTEGEKLLSNIKKKDYVIALCIEGKPTDNKKLTELIRKAKEDYYDSITFVIGGSLGLSCEVIKRADYKLSFSNMTFPHQLMRAMLLEVICDS